MTVLGWMAAFAFFVSWAFLRSKLSDAVKDAGFWKGRAEELARDLCAKETERSAAVHELAKERSPKCVLTRDNQGSGTHVIPVKMFIEDGSIFIGHAETMEKIGFEGPTASQWHTPINATGNRTRVGLVLDNIEIVQLVRETATMV